MRSCVQIAKNSFLIAVVAGMNRHAMNDATKSINARTVTMSRFGPSGSLKRKKSVLDQQNAVIPKTSNDPFVTLKCIEPSTFVTSTLWQSK